MKQYFKPSPLEHGFVRIFSQPHTRDIEALPSCLSGVETSNYYFLCRYFHEPVSGEELLTQLQKLQDIDAASSTYGCMRWYWEEPCIRDTNGAFFVLKPLAMAMQFCREQIPAREQEFICSMLHTARRWFCNECRHYGLFYSNKITSDGAMLAIIGVILQDRETIKEAERFWNIWLEYTYRYGWGWGENTSACYYSIIVEALDLALSAFSPSSELYQNIFDARSILLRYRAFHDGMEFIPSIRSYNFEGNPKNTYRVDVCAESYEELKNQNGSISYSNLAALILHRLSPVYHPPTQKETFRRERIFKDSYAVTYKGENIRLGTVSHFPVMPGCYQNDGWGLGWQSMPVSVLAVRHGVSFLRYASRCQGKLRTHPAYQKHEAYLSPSLFADQNIPDVDIVCHQHKHTAVVVKKMRHIANQTAYLADEWYLPSFSGKCLEYRGWFVLHYGDCLLAVRPMGGTAQYVRDKDNARIVQTLYEGEETLLVRRQWITCWAVAVLDYPENWRTQLDQTVVSVEFMEDLCIPRETKPFRLCCGEASLEYDPSQ